jgi:tetratricopeptide (TPR) repeat protein
MPLSGLSICAVADRVVVKEGASRWHAESGQYLLAFEGDPANGSLSVIERTDAPSGMSAEDWFDKGAALEEDDPGAAIEAYQCAVENDCTLVDAHVNLGWLLHQARRYAEAERAYREAIDANGNEPLLLYNFGVLLDDMGRKAEAAATYEAALRANPSFADCHYNLALICEELDKPQDAIRHMSQYRRLTGSKPK